MRALSFLRTAARLIFLIFEIRRALFFEIEAEKEVKH